MRKLSRAPRSSKHVWVRTLRTSGGGHQEHDSEGGVSPTFHALQATIVRRLLPLVHTRGETWQTHACWILKKSPKSPGSKRGVRICRRMTQRRSGHPGDASHGSWQATVSHSPSAECAPNRHRTEKPGLTEGLRRRLAWAGCVTSVDSICLAQLTSRLCWLQRTGKATTTALIRFTAFPKDSTCRTTSSPCASSAGEGDVQQQYTAVRKSDGYFPPHTLPDPFGQCSAVSVTAAATGAVISAEMQGSV